MPQTHQVFRIHPVCDYATDRSSSQHSTFIVHCTGITHILRVLRVLLLSTCGTWSCAPTCVGVLACLASGELAVALSAPLVTRGAGRGCAVPGHGAAPMEPRSDPPRSGRPPPLHAKTISGTAADRQRHANAMAKERMRERSAGANGADPMDGLSFCETCDVLVEHGHLGDHSGHRVRQLAMASPAYRQVCVRCGEGHAAGAFDMPSHVPPPPHTCLPPA